MTDKISYMIPGLDDERFWSEESWPEILAERRDDCEPVKTGIEKFKAMKAVATYHRASLEPDGNVAWETQPPAHNQLAVVNAPGDGWFEEDIYDSAADYFAQTGDFLPTWFAVLDHARNGHVATVDWDEASVTFAMAPETSPALLVVPTSGPLSDETGMIAGSFDDVIGMTKR